MPSNKFKQFVLKQTNKVQALPQEDGLEKVENGLDPYLHTEGNVTRQQQNRCIAMVLGIPRLARDKGILRFNSWVGWREKENKWN